MLLSRLETDTIFEVGKNLRLGLGQSSEPNQRSSLTGLDEGSKQQHSHSTIPELPGRMSRGVEELRELVLHRAAAPVCARHGDADQPS